MGLKVSQRGLSLLKESSHPLLFVVGCKGQTKIGSLHIEATVQISIYASLNAHLGEGDGVAALGQHFVSHHEAEIEQLRLRNHLVYKADAIGLLCVNFIAGKNQLLGAALAYKPGKPLGSTEARQNS